MKDYDKNRESSVIKHWIGNTSQFNKDFIKNYNKDTDEGYSF